MLLVLVPSALYIPSWAFLFLLHFSFSLGKALFCTDASLLGVLTLWRKKERRMEGCIHGASVFYCGRRVLLLCSMGRRLLRWEGRGKVGSLTDHMFFLCLYHFSCTDITVSFCILPSVSFCWEDCHLLWEGGLY